MAGDESPELDRRRRVNRERVVRTLTFWLRPEFVLRVVNRFQKLAGFDRSIALASGALTALIPLTIVASAFSSELGGKGTAERIIDRYDLTGGGAQAVEDIFSPASGTSTSLGIIGFLFLTVTVLSFSRAVQRLVEQTWELDAAERPQHVQRAALDRRARRCTPRSAASSRSRWGAAGRPRRGAARPAAVGGLPDLDRLGAQRQADRAPRPLAVRHRRSGQLAVYSVGAAVYVPHLFSTYATRYGVIGAVFAIISALFAVMVVVVGSAAAGREVRDELDRIRRGERPAEDEVRRQWDQVIGAARSRWDTLRTQIHERRHKDREGR